MSGETNHLGGLAAEQSVAAQYVRNGYVLLAHRWRGKGGEIDLIFEKVDSVIFVEVKKSRSFERAAESLGAPQMQRLHTAAAEFLAGLPKGELTAARFDVALVNAQGEIEILENALCA